MSSVCMSEKVMVWHGMRNCEKRNSCSVPEAYTSTRVTGECCGKGIVTVCLRRVLQRESLASEVEK